MFHPFKKVNLTYRNIQRLRVIVGVFMRHGLYSLMEMINLHVLIPVHRRIRKKKLSEKKDILSMPERIRLAFEELGPTFIKLGQLIASRPDLVPAEYCEEFNKLLDEVPPFPFLDVKRVIEDEFKVPVEEMYKEFNEKPVAAASIAQVHNALLHDGTPVVVKIQRPHIEMRINTDIELMYVMAKLLTRYVPETQIYNPVGIVDEFSRAIKKEMDFVLEASNIVKISRNLRNDRRVIIPQVHWDFTSSRVLTMQRLGGIRIDDRKALEKKGIVASDIARLLTDIFFAQVFRHGLFHGDLHAGNIFVVDADTLAFVDFGIVGRLNEDMIERLANILMGIMAGEYKKVVENYLEMGLVPDSVDIDAFRRDYQDALEAYLSKPLKEAKLGELLLDYTRIAAHYKIKLPTDLVLLDKCIIELEGLVRQLDPGLNMLKTGKRYAGELLKIWYSPGKVKKDLFETASEMEKTAKVLPGQIRQLMKKMLTDKFTIDFVHIGLNNLIDEIDRSSNRLALGLIISAIIIGSSLIMTTGKGPLFMGFPILGLAGFVLAGVLGFLLAVVIIRSRKF
ncbi:MAG: AarF/UbiB family protein [Deltaproteobacteria bacterium]|nr:AarF/UbiB family protein [Deltaproteobacteria bacterium]